MPYLCSLGYTLAENLELQIATICLKLDDDGKLMSGS